MYSSRYLSKLLKYSNIDVCAISEHWLFNDNLNCINTIDTSYTSIGVCDASVNPLDPYRRGKGGVALVWKKSLKVSGITIPDEDRIIGISMKSDCSKLFFIFCVYLVFTL